MAYSNIVNLFFGSTVKDVYFDSQYKHRIANYNTFNVTVRLFGSELSVPANETLEILSNGITDVLLLTGSATSSVYIQRELINTAPTQPGPFTQPTGELEIGDIRTFSWGASTDAEGGNIEYNPEYKINNGNWVNVNTTWNMNNTSTAMLIPTASTLQFRVKARDSAGLESTYRESPTYTVTKPKYFWSKYNVAEETTYSDGVFGGVGSLSFSTGRDYWSSYRVDLTTGQYFGTGTLSRGHNLPSQVPVGLFYVDGKTVYEIQGYIGSDTSTVRTKIISETKTKIRGFLIQSGLIAEEGTYPTDGLHTDGFWYARGSRVNQSIAPTGAFTAPTPATTLKPGQGVSVAFAASTAANISLYELEYRYNSGLWTTVGTNNTALSRSFTPTTDKTLTSVQFRVRAKNTSNVYSDYVYSETFNIEHNAKPTITLTTADNPSLTENANLVIAGQAVDKDNGNVLTVYYQINTGTTAAIATGISNGTTPLAYSKTLQFRQGTLYDGTTSVMANLVGNQTYTLKVWAEDNQGGKSDVQTRSFTVVPNRAPIVTVAALATTTDKINNDSITVNGTVTDPDNQTVVVKYKINDGALVQAYSGAGGNYTFTFKLASLNDGDNIVEIQASDVYGLTTTIKRKFTKTKNKKELLESVVRYRGILPAAGITGVVAWFEREKGDLTLTPALSLTTTGQIESFANMNLSNTGPVTDTITEDQYQLATDEPKTGMTLKVNLSRTATTSDKGIKKITGALQ